MSEPVQVLNAEPAAMSHQDNLAIRAQRASIAEHRMTILEAFRKYPWACFWSLIMTWTIVMEGYDTALLGSFFAYPSFDEQFGVYDPGTASKQIPAKWMVGLEDALSVGELIGLAIAGWAMERFGHRRVMMGSLIPMCGFIAIQFWAKSLPVLLVGYILIAIPWGVFTVLGTAYSSEVCPLALRAYMTSFTTIAWVIGQLIANGILTAFVDTTSQWSWRIPFAVQWVWPVPLFVLCLLAPESPYWLVRKRRLDDAARSLRRLYSGEAQDREDILALMVHTDTFEKEHKTGTSIFQCFKGTNWRRTEIVAMMYISQGWCGERFAYNPTYYFVQAGMSDSAAYKLNLGSNAISFLCIFVAWGMLPRVGRRTMVLVGLTEAALWAAGAFILLWIIFYSTSIGPLTYTLAGEVSATRLRNQTFAIGRFAYVVINIIDKVVEPYLINPTEANLKGKTAFVWFTTNTLVLIWALFRLPETRGRNFEELDILFEARTPTRKFASTQIEGLGAVQTNMPGIVDDEKMDQTLHAEQA